MSTYVSNRNEGKTDEAGHSKALLDIFNNSGVTSGLLVSASDPLAMSVSVGVGSALIPYSNYGYQVFTDAAVSVGIPTSDPSNPRIDRIVAYVDLAMARQTTTSNNPGLLKFADVPGTPAASPVAPSDSAVNTAVSNNPWIGLAQGRVNAGVTQISAADITDKRSFAKIQSHNIDMTTSTDDNGWKVTDYGNFKEYFKQFNGSQGNFPNGSSVSIGVSSLPVGMTDLSGCNISHSLAAQYAGPFCILREVVNNSHPELDTAIKYNLWNCHTAPAGVGNYSLNVTIKKYNI